MAINEQPQRSGWWINELESLGIPYAERSDEPCDRKHKVELRDLTEKIKEMMHQQHEIAYGKRNCDIDQGM